MVSNKANLSGDPVNQVEVFLLTPNQGSSEGPGSVPSFDPLSPFIQGSVVSNKRMYAFAVSYCFPFLASWNAFLCSLSTGFVFSTNTSVTIADWNIQQRHLSFLESHSLVYSASQRNVVSQIGAFSFLFFSFFFCLFAISWAAPVAHGGSQARGGIRAVARATAMQDPSPIYDLHHSSRQLRILNPLSEARDRTCNLIVPSGIH